MNFFEINTTSLNEEFYSIDTFLIIYSINYNNYIFFLNAKPHQNGDKYLTRYEISDFDIFSTNSETNKISDLLTTTLVQSTEISTTDETNDSSEITELTQKSESNKLIISTEIYQSDFITNEITSSTKATNEQRFESISTQIMTSMESTDIKITNKLTEFHKTETESINSSNIFEEQTETKEIRISIKEYKDYYREDECPDTNLTYILRKQ